MKKAISVFLLLLILLTGCTAQHEMDENKANHYENQRIVNGDLREMTASSDIAPTFLTNSKEEIAHIYNRVPEHQELLEHIPCYCGCGDSVGHKNNYECFVHEHFADGSLEWDDHGTRCGVCLDIAYFSMEQAEKGVDAKTIRTIVDEAYKDGYAEPTKTPMPKES